jgi:hypothetical protein
MRYRGVWIGENSARRGARRDAGDEVGALANPHGAAARAPRLSDRRSHSEVEPSPERNVRSLRPRTRTLTSRRGERSFSPTGTCHGGINDRRSTMRNDYLAGWFSNVDLPGEVVPPLRSRPSPPGAPPCSTMSDMPVAYAPRPLIKSQRRRPKRRNSSSSASRWSGRAWCMCPWSSSR